MAAATFIAPTPGASVLRDVELTPSTKRTVDVGMLLHRLAQLKGLRSTFDTHWQLVGDRVWPDWADFTLERSQGERRTQLQFDSTAAYALERFAAVLETFLTPRAQKWHELRASIEELNDEAGVKEWFDETTNILHANRTKPESGFYSTIQVAYKSHGAFGNAAVGIEPGRRGGIVYVPRHLKTCWVAHDDQGRIDTVYEEYKLSLKAAVQRFDEMLPEELRDKAALSPWEQHTFVRVVYPNDSFVSGRLGDSGKPFLSVDIEPQSKRALSIGGMFELSTVYSRYTLNPSEDYGRGPAMVSLADNLTLQEMEKTVLRSGELIAHPPLLLPHDGVLGVGGERIDMRAGALNYGGVDDQGNPLVKPLLTGGRLDASFEMQERKRQNIRSAMLLDLFEILARNPQMTATQAMLVAQERGVITAPIVGRLQQEMLGGIIQRELGLALRMGMLPEMPEALREVQGDYRVEYTSPATRSQRIEELVGVSRSLELTAVFWQNDPSLLEVFNGEETMRLAAELTGVPSAIIRSKEEFQKIVEAQRAAAEEQRQLEQLPELAKAAKSAAGAAMELQGQGGGGAAPDLSRQVGLGNA